MIRRRFAFVFLALAACMLVPLSTGCNREPAASAPSAAGAHPTPEESFEQIVQIVTGGLEMPGGGSMVVTQKDGSSSRFQVHNSITSKVTPPSKPDDPYRATLTVTSRSVYSLRKIEEESSDEEPVEQDSFGMMEETEEGNTNFEVMDDELVSDGKTDTKTGGQEIERVQRHSDEEVRNYDFAYENNRWVLKSKLDPKAPGQAAIASAIDRALRLQP